MSIMKLTMWARRHSNVTARLYADSTASTGDRSLAILRPQVNLAIAEQKVVFIGRALDRATLEKRLDDALVRGS